jgi:hypothetical protein
MVLTLPYVNVLYQVVFVVGDSRSFYLANISISRIDLEPSLA